MDPMYSIDRSTVFENFDIATEQLNRQGIRDPAIAMGAVIAHQVEMLTDELSALTNQDEAFDIRINQESGQLLRSLVAIRQDSGGFHFSTPYEGSENAKVQYPIANPDVLDRH